MGLQSDLTAIKSIQDGVKNNKVTRFAYTQQAYTENDADGHTDYVYSRENNIPTDSISVMEVNQTVVDKGFRARASSLTRMLLNHLFGRISYNLNKINDLFNDLLVKIMANMGVANGLATLDATGRIPYSMLPEDAMEYQGEWNASTNTPTLVDGTGTKGDTYNVSVGGTQTFGGESITFFAGDRIVYNGTVWQRLSSGTVQSVCEVLPDLATSNVDLSKQTDLTKIFNSDFLNKLFGWLIGKAWARTSGSVLRAINCLVHANNLYVAGTNAGIWWSEDGLTWSQAEGFNEMLYENSSDIVYANNLWAGRIWNGNCLAYSSDGKHWSKVNMQCDTLFANTGMWHCVIGGTTYWSTNFTTWTACTGGSITNNAVMVKYVNGLWFLGKSYSSDYQFSWSADGKTWRSAGLNSNAFNHEIYDVVYTGTRYLACGGRQDGKAIYYSSDGKNWLTVEGGIGLYIGKKLFKLNNLWLCIGEAYNGQAFSLCWSENETVWQNATLTGGVSRNYGNVLDIAFNNGLFVAGESNYGLLYSTDGKAWNKGTGVSDKDNYIFYMNNIWIAGSDTAFGVSRSADGKNWEAGAGLPSVHIRFFTKAGLNVIAGSDNYNQSVSGIWYSNPILAIDGDA